MDKQVKNENTKYFQQTIYEEMVDNNKDYICI